MVRKNDEYSMKELEKMTGVSRSAILYYIREGLLPKPRKTAKNMSYYDDRFIDGLKLIRQFREVHELSISQIKEIFERKSEGRGVELVLDVRNSLYRRFSGSEKNPPVTLDELMEESGLDEESLQKLRENNLLFPVPCGREDLKEVTYHRDNVTICRLFSEIIKRGASLDVLMGVQEKIEEIVAIERKATRGIKRKIADKADAESVALTIRESVELAQSLISLLHLHTFYRQAEASRWSSNNVNDQ